MDGTFMHAWLPSIFSDAEIKKLEEEMFSRYKVYK